MSESNSRITEKVKDLAPDPTVSESDFARIRERLRPYAEKLAFRQYLTSQIIEWETWYRSQVEEIRMHEIWRDEEKERLDRDILQGTVDPEDHDHIGVTVYEYHKEKVLTISQDLEFRLVADGEPICFREASIAAMVALFWSDINSSNLLVPPYEMLPDFDPFEPNGPFWKQLSLQWDETTQGRYKHIHWFVDAAIKAYEAKIADESEVPPSGAGERLGQLSGATEVVESDLGSIEPEPSAVAQVVVRLLNVYTDGLVDERLKKVSDILESTTLNVDEKLWKIDALMPFPPVSAVKLGKLFVSAEKPDGVSKTAIQSSTWYKQKRLGKRADKVDQRKSRLRQKGEDYDRVRYGNDD